MPIFTAPSSFPAAAVTRLPEAIELIGASRGKAILDIARARRDSPAPKMREALKRAAEIH